MAGTAKPNIVGLKSEGIIKINSSFVRTHKDVIDVSNNIIGLFDGITSTSYTYGTVMLRWDTAPNFIDFTVDGKIKIWALSTKIYSDAGGEIGKSVAIQKWNGSGWTDFKTTTTRNDGDWYDLTGELEAGRYKIAPLANYVIFDEWYVENLIQNKTLILHDETHKKYENRFNEEYTGNAPYYLKMSDTRNTLNNITVGNGNILFNGINSYIKSSVRVIPKGRKAIRVKVKFNSVGATAQTIISETNGSDTHGNIIMLNANGTITWASYKAVVGQNRFILTTSTTFVANKWYDMLFTWDGTTSTNALKIYVDNFTTPLIQGTANLVETADSYYTTSIGRFDLGGGQTYLNGEISLLEIYNTIPLANDIINNTTKYTIVKGWKDVSSTLPTTTQFLTEGMDSLSPLFDRRLETLEPLPMTSKSEILNGEVGKVFSKTLDLKKYIDLRNIKVEVK